MVEREPARILLIDDEAAVRVTLETLLKRRGYVVAVATNGAEGVAWLMQSSFDLLLVDLKLPGMDGLSLAHYAQQCQPLAAILFITGSSDFAGAPIEQQVGNFDYILKTASPQEVLERVASAIEARSKLEIRQIGA